MMESFVPRKTFAAASTPSVATTASGMPLRTAFLYHPNGVNVKKWHPTGDGKDFQLGETHQPLADFKDKLQIFANLDQINATGGEDGGGDHARAPGVWLTGLRIKKSEKDLRSNVSIDQIIAQHAGSLTPLPSLDLISDGGRKTGNCDNGYLCEYLYNVSWRMATIVCLLGSVNLADTTRRPHYKNNENKTDNTPEQNLEWMAQIEYWYMERFAKFVRRLDEAKDADGSSVLDNSIIMYGAGNRDSNSHTHNNLPTLVVGRGGGALNARRYVNAQPTRDPLTPPMNSGGNGTAPKVRGAPMCNFFLGMLEKVGIHGVDQFGDSTGKFTDL